MEYYVSIGRGGAWNILRTLTRGWGAKNFQNHPYVINQWPQTANSHQRLSVLLFSSADVQSQRTVFCITSEIKIKMHFSTNEAMPWLLKQIQILWWHPLFFLLFFFNFPLSHLSLCQEIEKILWNMGKIGGPFQICDLQSTRVFSENSTGHNMDKGHKITNIQPVQTVK